jgi:hypothetical protein
MTLPLTFGADWGTSLSILSQGFDCICLRPRADALFVLVDIEDLTTVELLADFDGSRTDG